MFQQKLLEKAYCFVRITGPASSDFGKRPKSHFISRLSVIVRVNVVLNRTVVDSDGRFDNLLSRDVIGYEGS